MPDTLNKQSLINLLIDSPLREPIKINLIDIVNNTSEPDLPKVYSTITKELEIFQKATERRMKLADETIAKLGGVTTTPTTPTPVDMPPSPTAPAMPAAPAPVAPTPEAGLTVPPLDLPPMPTMPKLEPVADVPVPAAIPTPTPAPVPAPAAPTFAPLGSTPMNSSSDEDALAEIQKELDSLKTEAAADISKAAAPAAPTTPAPQA